MLQAHLSSSEEKPSSRIPDFSKYLGRDEGDLHEPNPQNIEARVGVLRSEWYDSTGGLKTVSYGTGVAITKRLILTCGHTVYMEKTGETCHGFSFIPGIDQGKIRHFQRIYKSAPHNFLYFDRPEGGISFRKKVNMRDIALVYLGEDLDFETFPRVGLSEEERHNYELSVSGYPSEAFSNQGNLKKCDFEKVRLHGDLLEIADGVIYHNLATRTGHSGSALVTSNSRGESVIVGVHTHRGRRGMGVHLDGKQLQKLMQWEQQCNAHHQDNQQILFPGRVRDEKKKLVRRRTEAEEEEWVGRIPNLKDYMGRVDQDQEESVWEQEAAQYYESAYQEFSECNKEYIKIIKVDF